MAAKSKTYNKLESAVTEALEAIREATSAYVKAREAYLAERLQMIRANPEAPLPWSVLTDLDRVSQEKREAVVRSNAEIDAKAARGPRPLA